MRAKYRQVGVIALFLFIAVSVDNREVVIIVFLRNKASRILAENPNLVFKRLGISYQLTFIQNVVYLLHNFVAYFHSYSYIHNAGSVRYIMLRAHLLKPFRPPSSCCDNGFIRQYFLSVLALVIRDIYALAYVTFKYNIVAVTSEDKLYPVIPKVIFKREIKLLRLFRAQMSDRTVNQL